MHAMTNANKAMIEAALFLYGALVVGIGLIAFLVLRA
jgi:hypothetical protein